ncbi:MAG: hypothetical protein QUT30_17500 [Acidobacteriota bacterium]|jgi:hypothetical protein|nr:hypothetical protein [Acidobacteriota bacterium]
MKNRLAVWLVRLFGLVVTLSLQPALAQDNTAREPAPLNTPVRSMIELGSVYTNIYDITITVTETLRGSAAMERLKAANPGAQLPAEGLEYVLAHIKFDLKGRSVSDNLSFGLGEEPLQWIALSGSDLTEYDGVSVTVPKPALVGRVKPGSSIEGWVAFAVRQTDLKPVMVFDPDAGGATGRGKTVFFKLYR